MEASRAQNFQATDPQHLRNMCFPNIKTHPKVILFVPTLCFALLFFRVHSAPIENSRTEMITKFRIDPWNPEKYHFEYETSFGTTRYETGYMKTIANGVKVLVTKGFYSYVDTNGKLYRVDYYADENGYHPSAPKIMYEPGGENEQPNKVDNETKKINDQSNNDNFLESIFYPNKNEQSLVAQSLIGKGETTNSKDLNVDDRLPPAVVASLLGGG